MNFTSTPLPLGVFALHLKCFFCYLNFSNFNLF
uniref:Uncharacterized protein n=1 Tax=Myoviridae sp. ct3it16 TaxID=2825027 RepID=A0A8S5PJB9_9CAUD|nr:MAG TPA: hypothetical protein [Myoviridae sp. ct3it16]